MQCLNIYTMSHCIHRSQAGREGREPQSSWCFKVLIKSFPWHLCYTAQSFHSGNFKGNELGRGQIGAGSSWKAGSYTDRPEETSAGFVFKRWIIMRIIHDCTRPTKGIQTRCSIFKRSNGWPSVEMTSSASHCYRRRNWGPESWSNQDREGSEI